MGTRFYELYLINTELYSMHNIYIAYIFLPLLIKYCT
nr:MAG TPA: hypothetical protein [Caudoviricetes sp.]